jgi:hypothetical protein
MHVLLNAIGCRLGYKVRDPLMLFNPGLMAGIKEQPELWALALNCIIKLLLDAHNPVLPIGS